MKFIDEVTISVASGNGGPGCVSFRRESGVPRGGPDGGDGGKGGDVIFRVNPQVSSLLDLRYKSKYRAGNGLPGQGANRSGQNGDNLVIEVPPGTLVRSMEGGLLEDLGGEPRDFLFLKGGLGGKGNTFYKTSVNQAPTVAQKGLPGEEVQIHLELKLLADVGIIGFPNAGKSTLISVISAAKPKIADYPFTTLIPNLGVVKYGEDHSFVVADIPGLVPGAHRGVGLGIQFLKHVERTRLFVHLIDGSSMAQISPLQAYQEINRELELYDEAHRDQEDFCPLQDRPQLVVINKVETLSQEEITQLTEDFLEQTGEKIFCISAATGKNLKDLVFAMGQGVFKSQSLVEDRT